MDRLVVKERAYVSHRMRLLKLHDRVKKAVKKETSREYVLIFLRVEPEQHLALVEEVMKKSLTIYETRDQVRQLLGKELKWRLVPIRIEPAVYDRLAQIAPEGDVAELLKQAIEKLLQGIQQ